MVNGRLVEGAHSIAGEIRHITDRLQYRHPLHFNAYDPADVLDMVAQMLAVACATYDPEVIALRCDILPDMDEVAEELARYIPRDRQPKLVHVDNYNECILLGMMVRCLYHRGFVPKCQSWSKRAIGNSWCPRVQWAYG